VTEPFDAKEDVMSHTTTPSRNRRRRGRSLVALLAAGAVAGPALLATGTAATASPTPPDLGCHLTNFSTATVEPLVSADPAVASHRLTVTGNLPIPSTVTLVPLTYIRQPEHWGIEVMACPLVPFIGGGQAQATTDTSLVVAPPFRRFRATLDFKGSMGTCGIEVIGATTRQSFDLAGPEGCGTIAAHS
jgi:hypothetical protein